MNIPPKYEDLVFQLNELNKREAALREEIEMAKQVQETTGAIVMMVDAQRDHWIEKCGSLKQRLTVAEQRADELEGLLFGDILEAMDDFGDRHDLKSCREIAKDIRALKPAEGEGS